MKVAVLFKDGFEEIEALSVVDVLRRANVSCMMVGMDTMEVTSNHNITIQMDQTFDSSISKVDMIVLPGGMPGAKNLKDDSRVIALLQDF
ncbi:MAG: DJ-1/PfpI family protein, partial [Coprobacillaceae bacterium]